VSQIATTSRASIRVRIVRAISGAWWLWAGNGGHLPICATSDHHNAPEPVYRHGDCSWLPKVALQAGWQVDQLKQLRHIALRESGCCPARAGGDIVDKDCNKIGHDGSFHSSDSGLMQVNGTHWKPDHAQYHGLICKQMGICTQAPLFDPLTNLKAARLLYEVAGWSPWSICHRDKTCK
jgi:hypothetical protein